MTRTKINYETQEVVFYKFVCKDATILYTYAGHTTSFRHRKTEHKSRCNNSKCKAYTIPLYQFIRANGGWDNWEMRIIKTQLCKDKMEARQIETELIDEQAFKLNYQRAYVSEDEKRKDALKHYYAHNTQEDKDRRREYASAYHKAHYQENKEETNAKLREKRKIKKMI